jgi:hypothetical protein
MKSARSAAVTALLALAATALAACESPADADAAAAGASEGQVSVAVAPLSLPGVSNACYGLTVRNGEGEIVWQQSGLCSDAYGNGAGGIAYVGTCDAAVNSNTVTLELEGLFDANNLPIKDFADPCAGGACTQTFDCVENSDVAVDFDLTILRALGVGFVDVSVNLDDIYCSAKVDCDSQLLIDPQTGERLPTVVLGLACSAGPDVPTHLYRTNVEVVCPNEAYSFDPTQNGPGQGFVLRQAAYTGVHAEPGASVTYWNVALGLAPGQLPAGCVLRTRATAADGPFPDDVSPAGYPVIVADVPLTNVDGTLDCGQVPLNGAAGGLTTVYGAEPTQFAHQLAP